MFLQKLYHFLTKNWKFSYRSSDVEDQFKRANRIICISAHSTPFLDGILLHEALKSLGVYNHIIYVKGLFGFIPSWCKEITNDSFLSNEIKLLNSQDSFCRVFFPSGGNVKWKTGFYVLAKETNSMIVVIGIDYKTKTVQIDSLFYTDEDYCQIKTKAIIELKKYQANLFYILWRILFGYGCETYDISPFILQWSRLFLGGSCLFTLLYLCF